MLWKGNYRNSLVVQCLRLSAFTADDQSLIPGRGTNIPQASHKPCSAARGKKKVSVVEHEVETTCACRTGLCLQSHFLLLHFCLEENMKGGS